MHTISTSFGTSGFLIVKRVGL